MSNRLKHNLLVWLIYTLCVMVFLSPVSYVLHYYGLENGMFKFLVLSHIGSSIIIGFLFSQLNDITTQLRMLNGEKFSKLSDKKNKLIKS